MVKQIHESPNKSLTDSDADNDSVELERGDATTKIPQSNVEQDSSKTAESQACASSPRSPDRKRAKPNTDDVSISADATALASSGEGAGKTKYGKLGINDDRFFTVFEQIMPTHVWWEADDLLSLLRAVPKGSIGVQRVCWTRRDNAWKDLRNNPFMACHEDRNGTYFIALKRFRLHFVRSSVAFAPKSKFNSIHITFKFKFNYFKIRINFIFSLHFLLYVLIVS